MALLNMINKMDTSEAPCSRKAKRQQKVEIQQDAFDIDDDEEIPIITEETEEELAAFEAVNRPRTTSGKIRVTEETRPETAASLKYRPKSGRSTFDSRPTTAVTLKTKSRTVSRASSRKSRAESGFSRNDRGQYYDSDSDEEPRSPTKRDLFLEAELSNVDSILADDKAFDTDLEIEETTTTYDRKTDYINDCKKNGIVPASYFLRHMEKPQLTMSHHGLGEEGMKCIARSLASNTTVLNLDISDNWLGDTGGLIVCNMLKENIYITDLTLRDNRLGFGCAEQIGEVMKTNSTLTHLTLSGNQFDDKSAIFFADAITASKLEYLNLSHNRFGEVAGLLLGPAIAENTTMKELDISWNNIRRKGAMALGQGIKKHRSTIWREQLKKNNPQKYKQYLEKQKEHSKTNRQKLKSIRLKKNKTPEEEQVCKNILENLRMRQAKLRQRKKEKTETPIKVKIGSNKNTKSKPSTRKNVQTKREKWRVAKAKYRANTSNYKKRWVKEKDKNRKKTTKDDEKKMQLPKLKQKTEKSHDMIGYKTKQSLWNKASSVRQQLPTTPRKFVDLLTHIIKNTTPRKKDAIYEQLIQKEKKYASIFMRRNMAFTKDLLDRNTLRYLKSYDRKNIVRKALKNLKIQPRKTRKDKFSKTKENLVKSFFLRTARVLPQKRYTTKYGPGYSLQMTLTAAFKTFRDENPTIKLSFSKFISLKPKCVRLLTKTQWNVCVCPTCFNIKYKLTCLNRAFSHHKSPRNEKELVNFLLCRKPDARRFHQSKCIYGICEMCSSHEKHCNIVQHYRDLNTDQEQIRKLSWNHWERKMGSDGKIRKCLVQKEGNVHQCLEELQEDVEKPTQGTSLVKHVFTADWQQFQFNTIKDNLPKDNILMVMDFGRNRVVRYQDEIKSAYFAAAQITIHPIVLFYHSNDVPELIVRHSLVFLSDDITHDSKAVEYFQNKTLEFLDEKSIPYKELIIFSDGCAGQYKSRHTFAKLAQENVVIQRHYFGSEHGKSESDGEVAAVNKAVDSVVIGRRAIITNATDMYNWCCEHIVFDEPGSKRDFFLVDKNIIEHSKEDTVKPIKGIRQIHQVNNDPQTQGALNIKKVSCFCEQCLKRDYERCINSDYTDIERIKIQNEGKDVKESKRKTIIQGNKNSENKENAKLKVKEKKTTIKKKKETASAKPKVPVVPQEKKTAIKKKKETASSKPKVPVVPQEKKTSIRKKNETVSSKPKVVKQSVPLRTAEQQQPPNEHTAIDRKQYFDLKLQELQRCADYDILLALCTQLDEEFKQIEIVINEDTNIVSNNLVVDRDASNLFPKLRLQTTKFVNYLPVVVYGDGNCLPRSISTLVFGNENNFKEIRARITVEMCINAELYLKNENLIKGNSFPKKDASYLLNTYIMFLEQYTPGDRLTRNVIRRLYEEEVLNSCKNGSWMGIWELLAVSSVLKCEIMSVYPDVHTDVVPRTVLHRRILPLKEQEGLYSISAAVMWSSTRNDGFINHFVPLLPLHRQESHSVNTEPLICFDDSDTSLNEDDSFIKTFLENDVFMNIDNSDIDVMSEVLSSQANIVDEKSEVKSDDVVKSMPIEFEVVCRQANIGDEKSEVKSDDVVKFEVLSSQANIGDEKSEVKSDDVVKSVPVKFEVLSSQANIGDEKSEVKSDDVVKSVPVKFEVLSSQANIGDEKSKVKSDDVVKSVPVKFEVLSSQANIGDEKSAVKSDDVVKSVPVKFEVLSSQANIVNEKSEVKSDDVVKSVPVKFEVLSSQANIGDEKSEVKSDDVVKSVPVKFEVLSSQANIGDEKSVVKSDDVVKSVPVKFEVLSSQANIGDEKSVVKSDDVVKSVPVKFEVLSSQANIGDEKSEVKSDDVVKSVPVKFEVLSSQANIGDEKSVVKSDDVVKSVPVKFEVLSSQANIGDEKSEVKSDDEVKVVPVKSEVLCSQANIGDEKSEVKSDDEVKSDVDVMDNSALETTVAEKSRTFKTGDYLAVRFGNNVYPAVNNDFMKKMNVSWNGFGVEGAISLCDALKHNQVLEELNVMNCRLTTEAAVLIGKGLAVNETTALKVIKIGKNPMQSAGCYGICAAILRNPNCVLEEIDFEDVLVNKDFEEIFKQVKEQLPNIKMKHGGMEPPQKPKAKIHPMVKLMNYIEKNNLKLIDFFSQLDKDGSMCISYDEFEQGLEENGIKLTKEEIELLLEELDSDGDGDINFSELATGHTEFKERTDNINTILTASQPRPLTT